MNVKKENENDEIERKENIKQERRKYGTPKNNWKK